MLESRYLKIFKSLFLYVDKIIFIWEYWGTSTLNNSQLIFFHIHVNYAIVIFWFVRLYLYLLYRILNAFFLSYYLITYKLIITFIRLFLFFLFPHSKSFYVILIYITRANDSPELSPIMSMSSACVSIFLIPPVRILWADINIVVTTVCDTVLISFNHNPRFECLIFNIAEKLVVNFNETVFIWI